MTDRRFAIIDPAAGASGDMLLGALIAAGAPREWLATLPARLGCPDVTVEVTSVDRAGVRATKVIVRMPDGSVESPGEPHAAAGHSHPGHEPGPAAREHGHRHRQVGDLLRAVRAAELSEWVREHAEAAFRLLGEAEGRVHGVPAEQVTLHEVGALDALVDIVGVIEGFERLGLTEIYHRPVAVGDGWVRAAHGVLPVPAPATALLLEGLEIAPNGPVRGEALTPTGAVLLRVLSRGAPPEGWRALRADAWGAGTRNPEGYANALRLMIAEPADEAAEVVVLATDLDDLSPEYLEPLRQALSQAGALDVQMWSSVGKKGRIGFRIEALARPSDAERVTEAFFRHSTTLGVRRWRAGRITLRRSTVVVPVEDGGAVRVKLAEAPEGVRAKPEYNDIVAVAASIGKPAHALAGELQTPTRGRGSPRPDQPRPNPER